MYIVTITGKNALNIENGEYYVEDINAGELLVQECCTVHDHFINQVDKIPDNVQDILIVRPGGFGDLLFLTPALMHLAKTRANVCLSCFPWFKGVLEGTGINYVPYPLKCDELEEGDYDTVIFLEGVVERNNGIHIIETFNNALGVKPEAKKQHYSVTSMEREDIIKRFPKAHPKRLGLQFSCGSPVRDYSREHCTYVLSKLWNDCKGTEFVLFSADFNIKGMPSERILDVRGKLNFREMAALLSTCDAVMGLDSSITHLAGALGVPCVALFGSFHWKYRTSQCDSTKAIQGIASCAPCFHRSKPFEKWPAGKMCEKSGKCEALESIRPDRVVSECKKLLVQE